MTDHTGFGLGAQPGALVAADLDHLVAFAERIGNQFDLNFKLLGGVGEIVEHVTAKSLEAVVSAAVEHHARISGGMRVNRTPGENLVPYGDRAAFITPARRPSTPHGIDPGR